jgi:phosphoglycerate dehydrogenase-like enzyme
VLSPHLGYVTLENYRVFFADAVDDIAAWLDGRIERPLTPEPWTRAVGIRRPDG